MMAAYSEVEPNNTSAAAEVIPIQIGDILSTTEANWLNIDATISAGTDVDYFRFTLAARAGLFLDVDSREGGLSNSLDSSIAVFDGIGTQISENDNGYDFHSGYPFSPNQPGSGAGGDSSLYLDLSAGTYYIRISALANTAGQYFLRILADTTYSSSVPSLNSNPTASDTLLLDFDGHSGNDAWGSYAIAAFDFNENGAEYTPAERLSIHNTWRVVSEDYSPFAINISTSYAGPFTNGVGFRQVIGNSNGSEVNRTGSLGVAILTSYAGGTNTDNVAFTFASNFAPFAPSADISARIVAIALEIGNTSSHEFGHALGLRHFVNAGQDLAVMYTPDNEVSRETWYAGTNDSGVFQDDVALISHSFNTFGYRADDHGGTIGAASPIASIGATYSAKGIIGQLADNDFFRFSTEAAMLEILVDVEEYVNNLDVEMRLYNSAGSLLFTAEPSDSFDALITATLSSGTYYIEVKSDGEVGETGRYSVAIRPAAADNAPPVISLPGGTLAYAENMAPVVIDALATLIDPDSPNFDTGMLTISFAAGGTADDRLAIRHQGIDAGQIGVGGGTVTYGGISIGSVSGGIGTSPLVVILNSNATVAAVEALLRNVTFANVSDNPVAAPRSVEFVLTDGDGGTSSAVSKTISVASVNDAPVQVVPATVSGYEDLALVFSGATLISVADVDATNLQVTLFVTTGGLSLSGLAGLNFSSGDGVGDAAMTFTGTVANVNAALNGLRFTSPLNFNGTATLTVMTSDLGETGAGGPLTDSNMAFITINPVNDPPSFIAGPDQVTPLAAGAQSIAGWASGLSPGPEEANQTLAFDVTGNTNPALFSTGPAVDAATGNLTFTPSGVGTATISLVLRDNGGVDDGGIDTSATHSLMITITPLQVVSVTPTATGFIASFNAPLDASSLNLYDSQLGGLGTADVVLQGAVTGTVTGSLVVEAGLSQIRFLRTTGPLPVDVYTLSLSSGMGAFRDTAGSMLDGDGNGVPGDAFVTMFTVVAPPANAVTISVPSFARGPGQPVNIPASTIDGIPLTVSNASAITSIELSLAYDPAVLTITGATLGAGLPTGAVLNTTSTPGLFTLHFSSPTPLPAGPITFARLQATVPTDTPYTAKHLLDLAMLSVNGGAIPSLDRDGLHVAAYLGDLTGNGTYSGLDTSLAARLTVRLDSGATAYQLLDPVIMADITANGSISGLDTSTLSRKVVGLGVPEIPALPGAPTTVTPSGPDPKLSVASELSGAPGQSVTIPILIDSIVDLKSPHGLLSADVALQFDPQILVASSVMLGDVVPTGWNVTSNIDNTTGRLRLSLSGVNPLTGEFAGTLLNISFLVKEDAAQGPTAINLVASTDGFATQLNEAGLTLIPAPTNAADDAGVDGILNVIGIPRNKSQILVTGAGAGGGPHVRVFDAATYAERFSWYAYNAGFTGGVRVAVGDVTGDGMDDIITSAGPGGGPHVRVFDGHNGQPVSGPISSFFAFAATFNGGAFVAAADFNKDGRADVVTAADAGGGPHVRVFSGVDGTELASFFAYDPGFGGGVRVATGDVDGDGTPDLITGAGPGGGPHVRVFSGRDWQQLTGHLGSFFAGDPSNVGGLYVAAGELDGNGRAEVLISLNGSPNAGITAFNSVLGSGEAVLLAYQDTQRLGSPLAVGDRNGDGALEIVMGSSAGIPPRVTLFNVDGSERWDFSPYPDAFLGGTFVATSVPSRRRSMDYLDWFTSAAVQLETSLSAGNEAIDLVFSANGADEVQSHDWLVDAA